MVEKSWILEVFDALIENREEIISKTNKKIKISKIKEKTLNDVGIANSVEDLQNLINDIQVKLFSPSLDSVMVLIDKYIERDDTDGAEEIKIEEILHLKEKIIEYEEKLKKLSEENEDLLKLKDLSEKDRLFADLEKDLIDLENYCNGIKGATSTKKAWQDFEEHLGYIFEKYLNFKVVPRTDSKDRIVEMDDEQLDERTEEVKSKGRGTVDVHLKTKNAKKLYTLHVEAKSSKGKAKLDVAAIFDHNKQVKANFLITIGPKFTPKNMVLYVKNGKQYNDPDGKYEFNFSIMTIQALKVIIQFMVNHNLTQEFLLDIIRLDSLICHEEEVTDILNSINRADYKDPADYFNTDLIIPKENLDVNEEGVKGVKRICEEIFKNKTLKYVFKQFIFEIQNQWENKSSLDDTLTYKETHQAVYNIIKDRYKDLDEKIELELLQDATKFLIFLSMFDFIDFKPDKDVIKIFREMKTEVKIDKDQIQIFKDKLKFFTQFF